MMRKFFVALLVGAVAVGMAAPTFAADLKFTGAYRVRFSFDDGMVCLSRDPAGAAPEADCSGNEFQTRVRPRFEVETEGGVRGVVYLEVGDVRFGRGGATDLTTPGTNTTNRFGGGHGADGLNVETKHAYIDFPVPATPLRLRAGIQPFSTSKALLLGDDGSGLTLYGKIGEADVKAWWFRPNRQESSSGSFSDQIQSDASGLFGTSSGKDVGGAGENARDLYAIDVSFSPMKDLNLNAYFIFDHDMETSAGPTATTEENTVGYWFGAAAAGKVQNIRWDFDFLWGAKETPHPVATTTKVDQAGFMVDGGLGMALPGTPLDLEVRGWYASGWDGTGTGDIDALPALYGGASAHVTGAQIWTGDAVVDIDPTELGDNPQNTWGIGLLARWTVSPSLRVTGNVHYIGTVEEGGDGVGTNPKPSPVGEGFIYGVDSVGTDVGVRIDYTIARGLVFTLTGSYLFLGDDVATNGDRFDDAAKFAGVLNYGF